MTNSFYIRLIVFNCLHVVERNTSINISILADKRQLLDDGGAAVLQ